MPVWTLTNIKTKIEQDLDTEDELFVQDTELTGYINEAIREAEAEMKKLGVADEYFLSKMTFSIVNGTESYAMPTGASGEIYANKIKKMVYINGARRYPIKRLRGTTMIERYHDVNYLPSSTEEYRYLILNDATAGTKIILAPTPMESVTNAVTIWYVRNAKELTAVGDICDIPEFINFIIQYVKKRVYEKEVGHPNLPIAMADLEKQRTLMIETLTDMVPDEDTELEQDQSFYEESV
jgi:hypothetical protein